MSSYLLLRNNKESGPYTIDEIRGMSLKSYDLLWAVGQSAAWRYPGEISELKSFAPPVPDQPSDPFLRKTAEEAQPDTDLPQKKMDSGQAGQAGKKAGSEPSTGSVYVNLPAQRKVSQSPISSESLTGLPVSSVEPDYDFSDLYRKQSSGAARVSGKVLWISTIGLLFGAGILTGFFISDRRKFFSSASDHTPKAAFVHPLSAAGEKENQTLIPVSQHDIPEAETLIKSDGHDSVRPVSKKPVTNPVKKLRRENTEKKDSVVHSTEWSGFIKMADSTRQNTVSKTDVLYQKIKTHPENYLSLVTGNYSTGILGGVSSFSVSLTNNSPILMDLVVVTVEYIQSNNKVFKTENLSFTDMQAGETVSLKAPKSNRGTKIAARIHIVNIRQLDLSYSN